MAKTTNYLPESREYFINFKRAKIEEYRHIFKALESPRKSGYAKFHNDEKLATYLNNLMGNFDEGLEDVSIPEKFSSPKLLVQRWRAFYEFIKRHQNLIDSTQKKLKSENVHSEPFSMIAEMHDEIKGCLEIILNMDEVKNLDNPNEKKELLAIDFEKFDIAIITALHDTEFEAFERLLPGFKSRASDGYTDYLHGKINNKKVIIATDDQMGMSAATALTTKLIVKFKPEYVIMGGIAAGVKSTDRDFGDVLIARFTFNYESGKYQYRQKLKQTVFEPNPEQIEVDASFRSIINKLRKDKANHKLIFEQFNATPAMKKPKDSFNVHFGPIASGSAVLADDKKVDQIKANNRKLIGIDMETFGVYYGCKSFESIHKAKAISIKSVSDFADIRKTDGYRDYAAHTSASLIIKLIESF